MFTWMVSFSVHKILCDFLHCSMSCGKNVIAKNIHTYLHSYKSVEVILYNALYIKPALRYTRTKNDWVVELGLKSEMG